jgi:hypothetical protein
MNKVLLSANNIFQKACNVYFSTDCCEISDLTVTMAESNGRVEEETVSGR